MTDTTTTAEAPQEPQDGQEKPPAPREPQEAPETAQEPRDDDETDGQDHPAAEAKRYRLRLRETEAERDALAAKLEVLQRAEVERHASHLSQPAAIWAAGVQLSDVLDSSGNVDPERVGPAIAQAADALGLAHRSRAPKPHPAQRFGDATVGSRGDGMADVIRGRPSL